MKYVNRLLLWRTKDTGDLRANERVARECSTRGVLLMATGFAAGLATVISCGHGPTPSNAQAVDMLASGDGSGGTGACCAAAGRSPEFDPSVQFTVTARGDSGSGYPKLVEGPAIVRWISAWIPQGGDIVDLSLAIGASGDQKSLQEVFRVGTQGNNLSTPTNATSASAHLFVPAGQALYLENVNADTVTVSGYYLK